MVTDRFVRFDWAAKRMLRDKANFGVLEGLITVLLGSPVKIEEILESEANQDSAEDKFNRVDIKAKNSDGEIIIVEIQQTRQLDYLERILYGVSKTITENISLGDDYSNVKKVYSISILYFDLGKGSDYLYHGQTSFRGVHTGDELQVSATERGVIEIKPAQNVFPEYFLIRVNEFNKVASTPLEEWIEYLKTGTIKDDTNTPGLNEARQRLRFISMSHDEQVAYENHLENLRYQNSVIRSAQKEGREYGYVEGRTEGLAEGRAEGRAEGIRENTLDNARKLKALGVTPDIIAQATGLSPDEISKL